MPTLVTQYMASATAPIDGTVNTGANSDSTSTKQLIEMTAPRDMNAFKCGMGRERLVVAVLVVVVVKRPTKRRMKGPTKRPDF